MNANTTSPKLQSLAATLLIGALAAGLAPVCHAADAADTPRMTVKFRDLNLATPEGAATLYSRLRASAQKVCTALEGRDLAARTHMTACVQAALADAVNQIGAPELAKLYRAKQGETADLVLARTGR